MKKNVKYLVIALVVLVIIVGALLLLTKKEEGYCYPDGNCAYGDCSKASYYFGGPASPIVANSLGDNSASYSCKYGNCGCVGDNQACLNSPFYQRMRVLSLM